MNPAFSEASFREFHRVFKSESYAWCYGNAQAEQLSNDMFYAYQAGGEL